MNELFIEMTDQLYWEGYTEQLMENNPTLYHFEFDQFLTLYPSQNHGTSDQL